MTQEAIDKYKRIGISIYEPFKVNQTIIKAYKVYSFPTALFVDPDGKMIFRGGSQDFNSLQQILKNNLRFRNRLLSQYKYRQP